jgi:dimethylhistidine N-methyltransferase
MRDAQLIDGGFAFYDLAPRQEGFADALARGLSQAPRPIPSRFLYDARRSALFDAICELPEYYPTRTEMRILTERADEIAALAGPGVALVELGSGSSTKVRLLLDALDRPAAYVAIDISGDHLQAAARGIAEDFPKLAVAAICADYAEPFALPHFEGARRRLGFFPGSTIGNLTPERAEAFLRVWAARLGQGAAMLIGVDLVKDAAVLEPAYDDAQGITAAFSLNLLARANRELGADFDLDGFRHRARWNPAAERIEIHLVSLRDQSVNVAAQRYDFEGGEVVHVEDSCKYTIEGFQALARRAGFTPVQAWTDDEGLFSVHWLTVE